MQALQARLQRTVALVTRHNDLMLALAVISIIFMMILPLPTPLIDALIATNMSIAAILLMVAMYLPSPLAFSSFPTVLLVTTLFRLGISIATTRLILLDGDAGHIIDTFGHFVVGGNLVVGLVVFLILTIVQFVVITKGAERVAEVAARFSLDAMPGKQMSIDGDLRANTIDMEEAKRRRTLVERESQLYGAMDGAMKFVKGDAIAGLIIVAVNLLGGMVIGTMQRGMSMGEAVRTYSILTIGDGLIAQIPALFIAICAGMIVTRVGNDSDQPSNIGSDIGQQVLARPRPLFIGAAIMLGMGLIPGMPTLTFLALAALIGATGYGLSKPSKRGKGKAGEEDDELGAASTETAAKKGGALGEDELTPTVPLLLDVATALRENFSAKQLNEELVAIRRALYFDLGVPFPGIQLRFNQHLAADAYSIQLAEVPVAEGRLRPGHLFVRESQNNLSALGIAFESGTPFLPHLNTFWVNESLRQPLTDAGIQVMDSAQILAYHLSFVLKKHAADFLGIQETRVLLTSMEGRFAELVKELTRIMPLQKIAEIFQRLVSEEVSIRNLRAIMESLIEWGQKEKDSVLLTEYVRGTLKRQICHRHTSGQNALPAYLLAPDLEETLRAAIRQTSGGSYLALDPSVSKRIVERIRTVTADSLSLPHPPVLLTSMDIRRYVRKMVELECQNLHVLSYQELTPDINIQPLARIEVSP
ncbi:Low calcium response locus protein D [Pandoraea iniqua]|uniref:Low calcium response locus protein D n=1 Tax=Pandoraea iniqua TaxID=2508288 RepID=A0A5E4YIX2_9BURK|nr:type III secretion system export apparatus subunit SctV [Pandoraea iniqua]VVE47933.1 Low calcium response locus protein D [Pandoraea iniqua]